MGSVQYAYFEANSVLLRLESQLEQLWEELILSILQCALVLQHTVPRIPTAPVLLRVCALLEHAFPTYSIPRRHYFIFCTLNRNLVFFHILGYIYLHWS